MPLVKMARETARWSGGHPAGKDHRDRFLTTDGDVVLHQGLEEAPGPTRIVEDERARHLDLAHGELPPKARRSVLARERGRDQGRRAVEEALDVSGTEALTDGLETGGILTRGEPIGERAVGQTQMVGLALGPFVAVQPYFCWPRAVGGRS